jgi:hypothetical protein
MEPRHNGLEHEEDVCAQHRLSLPLKRVATSVRRRAQAKAAAILIYVGTYRTIGGRIDHFAQIEARVRQAASVQRTATRGQH